MMEMQPVRSAFSGIIGQENVIGDLKLIFRHMNLQNRATPYLILMYGPCGVGKTSMAKCMAKVHGFFYQHVDTTSFMSKFQAESESQLRKIFQTAEENRPSVVAIDECDVMLSSINQNENSTSQNIKNLLLQIFNGQLSPRGVVIVCLTNRPWMIDWRQVGRFSKKFKFEMPNEEQRYQFFVNFMDRDQHMSSTVTKDQFLSFGLKLFSFRDVEHFIEDAQLNGPMRRTSKANHFRLKNGLYVGCDCRQNCSNRTIKTYEEIPDDKFLHSALTYEDMMLVRKAAIPSATEAQLDKYDRYEKGEKNIKDEEEEVKLNMEGGGGGGDTYSGLCVCNKFWMFIAALGLFAFIGYFSYYLVVKIFRLE